MLGPVGAAALEEAEEGADDADEAGADEAEAADDGAAELPGAAVSASDEQAPSAAPPPVRATIPAALRTVRRVGEGDESVGAGRVRSDTGPPGMGAGR